MVDDVVSTGHTIAAATQQCLQAGAVQVDMFVSHALFAHGAAERIKQAGVSEIWSTDSIAHSSNVVQLAVLLAQAVRT